MGMPGSRKGKAPTANRAAPDEPTATPLEKHIKDELTSGVRRRLGLADCEATPTEIQRLVDSAAREVAASAHTTAVVWEVANLRSPNGSIGNIESKPADPTVLREAERLAAKKQALQLAGFSSDEAMRILVAEVTGRASHAPLA
jgi:hypothetical protein